MILGFTIAGLSTMIIPFFDIKSFWFWAILLFVTRIGASMIEIMSETYLFKKINDSDIDTLSTYRAIGQFSYMLGPAIASILLIYISINYLFLILGFVVLSGIWFTTRIKDTL